MLANANIANAVCVFQVILRANASVSQCSFAPCSHPDHDIRAKWPPCKYDQLVKTSFFAYTVEIVNGRVA